MLIKQAKEIAKNEFDVNYLLGSSVKIDKSNKSDSNYYTMIMYLAPYKLSGKNVCPWASKGCAAVCLNTAGHGRWDQTQQARINRTKLFFDNRKAFLTLLTFEIAKAKRKADKLGAKLAIRLNGTSDIVWEKVAPELFIEFADVVFYDYTKSVNRMFAKLPINYSLTFSRSESNNKDTLKVLHGGHNVAVVFSGKKLPDTWQNATVINGDITDERFLDSNGYVIGLSAKGDARKDNSGFVIQQ